MARVHGGSESPLQRIERAYGYLSMQRIHDFGIRGYGRFFGPVIWRGLDFLDTKLRAKGVLYDPEEEALRQAVQDSVCFVKQIFRKSSSNSFGSQHERSSDFTKGCGTYPSFLFPSMSESVTRRLSPLNSTSLPWWTILSTSADASLSSANTVPHFPNSMLVVSTIDWRS